MRADDFLDLYRQLENVLETHRPRRRDESSVSGFIRSRDGEPWRETLNLARDVRNLLSHNPTVDGQSAVEPSDALGEKLKQIIDSVENPLRAADIAVPRERILFADAAENLFSVLRQMEKQCYTNVPVTQNGSMIGILSESVLFSCALSRPQTVIDEQTKVGDLREFLPLDKHPSEYYDFIDDSAAFEDVRELFERSFCDGKRLAAVLVTANGRANEKILGLITPWDALAQSEEK